MLAIGTLTTIQNMEIVFLSIQEYLARRYGYDNKIRVSNCNKHYIGEKSDSHWGRSWTGVGAVPGPD